MKSIFKSWLVTPLNPAELAAHKQKFHSMDISGKEKVITEIEKIEKKLYLIPANESQHYVTVLGLQSFKPCEHAANYLLGLSVLLKEKNYRELPGKYIVGANPKEKLPVEKSDDCLFLAIDFSIKSARRLTVAYTEHRYNFDYLLLAEKVN